MEWCCKFLCSFARVSSDNQKALFDHISYLLEHSEKNPGIYILHSIHVAASCSLKYTPHCMVHVVAQIIPANGKITSHDYHMTLT